MWIVPPYVDVPALLGIDAPLAEPFGHAGRGLKRGHVDKSLRERSEPGAFEIDPFWKGVWARLAFKPLLANPFGKESTDFAQWTAGWKQEESATWDITQTKEVVLSSVVKRTIHWGSRTSFSAGLAALLQGKSRASNPHAPGGLDHELWDDGWLRGFWLKGYAAAHLGEPRSYSERVLQSQQPGSDGGPLPDGSEELDWWQSGWEACSRRLAFEQKLGEIREAGEVAGELGATKAGNPHPPDTEESEAWLAGWRIGNRYHGSDEDLDDPSGQGSALQQFVKAKGPTGTDAYFRGEPLEANPHVPGSANWSWWKCGWRLAEDRASGVYLDEDEVPDDYDPDDREGNAKRAVEAREEQQEYNDRMDSLMMDAGPSDEEEEEYEKRAKEEWEAEQRWIEELVAEALRMNEEK